MFSTNSENPCHVACGNEIIYLLIHEAVENEDEESLEAIEDGKYVGHGDGVLVYIQDTEHPGQAQENHQDCCPFHPGPATDPNLSGTLLIICFMFRTAF